MPYEGFQVLSRVSIPQPHCVIPTSTCENVAIWRITHTIDIHGMPCEDFQMLSGDGIPQPHCFVLTTTYEGAAIR